MASSRKAQAFSWPPRDPGKGGHGNHCFLRGTHVLTPKGEVRVENLAIGDLVTTIGGIAKPIKWIGRRKHGSSSADKDVLPIKISRSALGHLVPHADLFVSPLHALYIDGMLVPARNLVNGRTIVQCAPVDADGIEYFHIELAGHDVIFAEGAPTETLLAGSEREFDNWPGDVAGEATRPVSFAPRMPARHSVVLRSRLRSAVSPLIDLRRPEDVIWDRLAERAETRFAA